MSVWIIPAADQKAAKNYPKTLSRPISVDRLNRIQSLTYLPKVDLPHNTKQKRLKELTLRLSRLDNFTIPRQANITANDCHGASYLPVPDCLAMAQDVRIWAGFEAASKFGIA